jgi:hypothetical protein
MKNQSLLLNVFSEMIGSFHDGLMITTNEEIIYNNNKCNSIFELLKEIEGNQDQSMQNEVIINIETVGDGSA